jgi:hypothetical protein
VSVPQECRKCVRVRDVRADTGSDVKHWNLEAGNETIEAAPGMLFFFEPEERGSVSTRDGARLLLFLAPWPGLGHYRGDERGAAAT